MSPFAKGRRLLDFGCGARAWFWNEALTSGWDADACDIKKANIDRLQKAYGGKRFFSFVGTELGDAHAEEFDVVNASEVLEHVPAPRATVEGLRRVLKRGGVLSLDVPNVGMALARLARGRVADPPAHLYYWSPATLRRLLEDMGFSVVVTEAGLGGLRRLSRVMDPAAAAACASRIRRFSTLGGTVYAVSVKI